MRQGGGEGRGEEGGGGGGGKVRDWVQFCTCLYYYGEYFGMRTS